MGYQDNGFLLGGFLQGFENDPFVQGIQIAGGFIQQEQGGVVEESSGNADALLFAAAMISSLAAPGLAMAMLLEMESWNRWVYWVT